MAVTGAIQCMGGNVVYSAQLAGRYCVYSQRRDYDARSAVALAAGAAVPCRFCSCNLWDGEAYMTFAGCVLPTARYMMNHRVRSASHGRYIGREISLQPGTARDRGRTAEPTSEGRRSAENTVPASPGSVSSSSGMARPEGAEETVRVVRTAAPEAPPPKRLATSVPSAPARPPAPPTPKARLEERGAWDPTEQCRLTHARISAHVSRRRAERRRESRAQPQ